MVKADIPAIREWRAAFPTASDEHLHMWIDRHDAPPAIKSLCPNRILISEYWENGVSKPVVSISWGGGLIGIWQLVVGPLEMGVPEPQADRTEYLLPLRSGAYLRFSE